MKRAFVFFLTATLLALSGAFYYVKQQWLREFKESVQETISRGPWAGKIKIGTYDVSLIERAGLLKEVRFTEPLLDNPEVRLELAKVEEIKIKGFKSDPEFGVPLDSRVHSKGIHLILYFKETGRRLQLSGNSWAHFHFDPRDDIFTSNTRFVSPPLVLETELAFAKVRGVFVFLRERELEDLPLAVVLSKTAGVVPQRFFLRYEDRGLLKRLFYASCRTDCDQKWQALAQELRKRLQEKKDPPAWLELEEGIYQILKEGRGGFQVLIRNKHELSFKDLLFIFLGRFLNDNSLSERKHLFGEISSYFELKIEPIRPIR